MNREEVRQRVKETYECAKALKDDISCKLDSRLFTMNIFTINVGYYRTDTGEIKKLAALEYYKAHCVLDRIMYKDEEIIDIFTDFILMIKEK